MAEWQATSLLELADLSRPPTPTALVAELPRITVQRDPHLPVSGCATWQDGRWLILLSAAEPIVRQRFSLAHELKHVIDHRDRSQLYVDRPGLSADVQAEQAADYFAACLLMPRRWVKRAWGDGQQRTRPLSRRFHVSPQAMSRRLKDLGLWTERADRPAQRGESATYSRQKHPMGSAA